MRALLSIAGFEVRTRAARLSTLVYFGVFFALALLLTLAAGGAFPGGNVVFATGDKVLANAPYALHQSVSFLGWLSMLVVSAVFGRAVQQDFEHGTFPLFFTSPISRSA